MRFLVDANLPPALAGWFAARGHVAVHLCETGHARRTDREIWEEALAGHFVIVSKDEDFARRRSLTASGPTVVWVRLGNTRRAALLAHLERLWPQLEEALQRGESIVEVA